MANLKHAISGFLAIAMVSSLALNQASDITPVKASEKEPVKILYQQPEILKGDGEGIVIDQIPTFEAKKLYIDENTGYIITTKKELSLKALPSEESSDVSIVKCADMLTILSEEGEYYKISIAGNEGYIKKDYVTKSYEEAKKILLEYFKYESGYVTADGVNIRDRATIDSAIILDQIDMGTKVFVIERTSPEWMKVFYGENYDIGYINTLFVLIDGMTDKEEVLLEKAKQVNAISKAGVVKSNGKTLNVYELPSEEAKVLFTLSDGENVRIVAKGSNWAKIAVDENGNTAYLDAKSVFTNEELKRAEEAKKQAEAKKVVQTRSGSGSAIVAEAEKYLGVKYVYGGTSPKTGFDCSGLVQYVCKNLGISVSRSSREQYSDGVAVSRENLQPGDLIFFSKGGGISHVVIYAGNGNVIHAPSPGKRVTYATLSYICSYSNYVGARRVA